MGGPIRGIQELNAVESSAPGVAAGRDSALVVWRESDGQILTSDALARRIFLWSRNDDNSGLFAKCIGSACRSNANAMLGGWRFSTRYYWPIL